ncbi:small GTP-binding protein [Histomonas meleagridis]|uniref:small GTP-binding protein n=1 Tax=Histomonas meleagridis TaxID=135588 RepID=UPI003559A83B|nr:small GTP-binding protein [Histomonas meleagridis]KAH0798203.1 small GTP-binding protein [Histomonas meleagridis]
MDFKIVFFGPSNAGKTSIIERYCSNVFNVDTLSTIGAQFFTKTIEVNNELINLYIWDTAGDERFGSMQTSYVRGSNALVLTYDLSNPNYEYLKNMLRLFRDEVKAESPEKLPVMILGNKLDLIDDSDIDRLKMEVEEFCRQTNLSLYQFVSAKEDTNINESFLLLSEQLIKVETYSAAPSIQLMAGGKKQNSGNCC